MYSVFGWRVLSGGNAIEVCLYLSMLLDSIPAIKGSCLYP
jgi:hypothetical protein